MGHSANYFIHASLILIASKANDWKSFAKTTIVIVYTIDSIHGFFISKSIDLDFLVSKTPLLIWVKTLEPNISSLPLFLVAQIWYMSSLMSPDYTIQMTCQRPTNRTLSECKSIT